MDRAARSLCVFGAGCKHGLNCHRGHTDVHKKMFADKKEILEKEWMVFSKAATGTTCVTLLVGQLV